MSKEFDDSFSLFDLTVITVIVDPTTNKCAISCTPDISEDELIDYLTIIIDNLSEHSRLKVDFNGYEN